MNQTRTSFVTTYDTARGEHIPHPGRTHEQAARIVSLIKRVNSGRFLVSDASPDVIVPAEFCTPDFRAKRHPVATTK